MGLFCSLASLVGDSGLPGAEHVDKGRTLVSKTTGRRERGLLGLSRKTPGHEELSTEGRIPHLSFTDFFSQHAHVNLDTDTLGHICI